MIRGKFVALSLVETGIEDLVEAFKSAIKKTMTYMVSVDVSIPKESAENMLDLL